MKTLDEDVESLKRLKDVSTHNDLGSSTGRKSNLAGLGAFKSLNKYNTLTSKYKDDKPSSNPNSSVEQSSDRGTIRIQDDNNSNTKADENTNCIRIQNDVYSNTNPEFNSSNLNPVFEYKNNVDDLYSNIKNESVFEYKNEPPKSKISLNINNNNDSLNYSDLKKSDLYSNTNEENPNTSIRIQEDLYSNTKSISKTIDTSSVFEYKPKEAAAYSNTKNDLVFEYKNKPEGNPKESFDTQSLDLYSNTNPEIKTKDEQKDKNASSLTTVNNSKAKEFLNSDNIQSSNEASIRESLSPSLNNNVLIQYSQSNGHELSQTQSIKADLKIDESKLSITQKPTKLFTEFKETKSNPIRDLKSPDLVFEYNSNTSDINSDTIRIQNDLYSNTDSNTDSNTKTSINLSTDQRLFFENSLKSLSSNMAIIFKFLYDKCSEKMSLETGSIYRSEMIVRLGLSEATIKGTISRLIKEKMLFQVIDYRTGASGWTKYAINPIAFEIYSSNKNIFEFVFEYKSNTDSNTNSNTKRSSKIVRNNYNTKLTNSAELYSNTRINDFQKSNLSSNQESKSNSIQVNWFKQLDFLPVSPIGPMQVNSSIRNLVQEKLQPEQVQDFLNRFKSWLTTQHKIQNPVAIFCDRLKEFATEGDSAVLSVMTDQEREIEAKFLEETQKARVQMQLIEKANEDKLRSHQEHAKLEAEAEFEKWYFSANDAELIQMVPPSSIAPLRSNLHKISIRSAFMQRFGLEETTV